jgi:mutator protein MutT
MTEYFDLYTADRVPLGKKISRGEPIPHGEYHIVVQVMTVNSGGEILLTQRVPEKTSGGKWECSGGCAVSGETSAEAAARELREETGISVTADELELDWTFVTESMLRDFYVVTKDVPLEELHLQAEEVSAAKWVSLERLIEMARNGQTTRTVARWIETHCVQLYRYTEKAKGRKTY